MSAPQFYLASKSPRRQQILLNLGYRDFTVLTENTPLTAYAGDEERQPTETSTQYVQRTAKEKALKALARLAEENLPKLPILAADTAVILGETVFGKPRDATEAAAFLRSLSGITHEVRTVVVLATEESLSYRTSVSRVRFKSIDEAIIARYTQSAEPYDKAGGYAIQGFAGAFVESIEGSFTGIMGLPAFETASLLQEAGIEPRWQETER